jgi:tetratricopeptide (TPR) repeat protein
MDLSATPQTCNPVVTGQSVSASTSRGHPACFAINVTIGHPTQLSVTQPVDMELRVRDERVEIIADEFQFGMETLTILAGGSYHIEVRPVDASDPDVRTISMSRRDVPLQMAELWQRAETSATKSKLGRKLDDINESLRLWKELDDASAIARTWLKLGDALRRLDDSVAARADFEEALRICDSLADVRCMAEAANNGGYAAYLLGDFDSALRQLQDAAGYWSRISAPLYEGRTLSNLGLLFWQSGDFEKAIALLDRARRILRGRDAVAYALVLNNLGVNYQSLLEDERALVCFRTALAVFLSRHQLRHEVEARLNIGVSEMHLGRLRNADATLTKALQQSLDASDLANRGNVLYVLGQVLLRLHRADEARARLEEALVIQRAVHSKVGEATALHYLGIEASQRGDTATAQQYLTQAARIRRDTGLRDDASESVFALAELVYKSGDVPAARDLAVQAIDLIESLRSKVPSAALRASYYSRKRRFFDLLVDIAMAPGNTGGVSEGFLACEQERGRGLLDLLTEGAVTGPVPEDLLERRTGLRRQIDGYSLRFAQADPPQPTAAARAALERRHDELRQRLELLLSEDEQVDTTIREAVHATALGHPLVSVGDLQAALPANSAVLEYYLGDRASYLWFVRPDGIQSFRLPPRGEIEPLAFRTADRFGAILERLRSPRTQGAFDADLRRLSKILLGPVAGVSLPPRLILVLDGVLNRVPIAALRVPGAPEVLGLGHDLIHAPSAAFLLEAKPPRPPTEFPRSVLAIADPVFGDDDPRLPATRAGGGHSASLPRILFNRELDALLALVPPSRIRILRGLDAAPGMLRRLHLRDYAVLHFSTHAFIDDQIPELSRVALSLVDRAGRPVDGYVYPYQFAEYRLNRSVVVLSSCETALGKEVLGEGLVGFADSLFSAGASQLVLSLAKVDAEASADFFTEAYRAYFGPRPAGMEHALTLARRSLAHSARWSDPYYWASFTMVGSPTVTRVATR